MAQENVGINITVGGNTEQALGSLKSQLRQATAEVQTLSDKFGATSEQAVAAAKRAAELKDQIGDAKSLVDAFNPDAKFKALSASLSGVAGGFAAVQGAVGLFGKESEDLQKTLVKVQSAMALSQGLQSVGESIDSFKQLGAVIKTQVVTSFTTLRGAIIATGIGALVVVVGSLLSKSGDWISSEKELKAAAEARQAALDASILGIERESELAQARAKMQGKSDAEILEIQKKGLEKKAKDLQDAADEEYKIYQKLYADDWGDINDETQAAYDKHVELQKQKNDTVHQLNLLSVQQQEQANADKIKHLFQV